MPKNLVQIPCPLCDNAREFLPVQVREEDGHIAGYGELYDGETKSAWKVCGTCGFVHQNPRPSAEALNAYYLRGGYHGVRKARDYASLKWYFRNIYTDNTRFIADHVPLKTGAVLDVGCGFGFALAPFRDKGWKTYGVEPDPVHADFARQQQNLTGVIIGLVDPGLTLPEPVDLVISHHAMEHFADLKGVMAGLVKVLKPGGWFFARLPTYCSNRSRMSLMYMNAAHYSLFTHKTLANLAARFGIEYVAHEYLNKAGLLVTDDLMFVGRFTGKPLDPTPFYENAVAVQRYVDVVNPMRSKLFAPVYSVQWRPLLTAMRVPGIQRRIHRLVTR
jgi:SAM-dependent methyltransferase